MRSKTFVLGIVMFLCLIPLLGSGTRDGVRPLSGLNTGEQMPSIRVKGIDWFRPNTTKDSSSILIVWSKEDAVSRIVNAWLSRTSDSNTNVYSICIDADQTDAELYARADNVNPDTKVLGACDSDELRRELKGLTKSGQSSVFFTDNGVIKAVKSTSDFWLDIQTSDPSSKI